MTKRPDLETLRVGSGKPILLIHGINPVHKDSPFLAKLAEHGEVIAPSHPGFGASPLPDARDRRRRITASRTSITTSPTSEIVMKMPAMVNAMVRSTGSA